jgi:RNA polymerase sigma factor (sigma-70 family)
MSYPQCPLCAHEEPCSCKQLKDCLDAFIPSVFEYLHNKGFEDDVVADACSMAWEKAIGWIADGRAALMNSKKRRGYLCRTARNLAFDILRRKARSPLGRAKPLYDEPPIEADPSRALVASEEAASYEREMALFKECFAALDDEDQCLLELLHVDGATYNQLGDLLGRNPGTAWRRLETARDRVIEKFHSKSRKKNPRRAS